MTEALDRRGLAFGISAYVIWGFFPIFMHWLEPAGALEIVAWRSVSSLIVCLVIAAALVIATSIGGDTIVYTLVGALTIPVVLIVLAGQIGKRAAASAVPIADAA